MRAPDSLATDVAQGKQYITVRLQRLEAYLEYGSLLLLWLHWYGIL